MDKFEKYQREDCARLDAAMRMGDREWANSILRRMCIREALRIAEKKFGPPPKKSPSLVTEGNE